jgi:hypothetical protein
MGVGMASQAVSTARGGRTERNFIQQSSLKITLETITTGQGDRVCSMLAGIITRPVS